MSEGSRGDRHSKPVPAHVGHSRGGRPSASSAEPGESHSTSGASAPAPEELRGAADPEPHRLQGFSAQPELSAAPGETLGVHDAALGLLEENLGAAPGLSWCWELDFDALMRALSPDGESLPPVGAGAVDLAEDGAAVPGDAGPAGLGCGGTGGLDQEAVLDARLAAEADGAVRTLSAGEVARRVAERLPVGPGLAALLGGLRAGELGDRDLPAVAAGFRRVAAWAQAGELSAVAQMASRAAAKDDKISVDASGRPDALSASACAEVSLALVMSQFGAGCWADLAITLAWRLAATGAALAGGEIDLSRARMIAEATSVLDDAAARAVEARVLADAGLVTTGQLRSALRRAVIAVDPEGAERRRKEAERKARVTLYPDDEGTAALCGSSLPAARAAAAMARIAAIARAWKASGAGGGADLLRAEVFIGLLLGTLPYIPPAEGGPPDPPDGGPPASQPRVPGGDFPGFPPRADPPGQGFDIPGDPPGNGGGRDEAAAASGDVLIGGDGDPGPGDQNAPPEDDLDDQDSSCIRDPGEDRDEDLEDAVPAPPWPPVPASVPAAFASPGPVGPAAGMLDLTLPWATLAGISAEPCHLGRIGPVAAPQALDLARATAGSGADWRVIVTTTAGKALAVTGSRGHAPQGLGGPLGSPTGCRSSAGSPSSCPRTCFPGRRRRQRPRPAGPWPRCCGPPLGAWPWPGPRPPPTREPAAALTSGPVPATGHGLLSRNMSWPGTGPADSRDAGSRRGAAISITPYPTTSVASPAAVTSAASAAPTI